MADVFYTSGIEDITIEGDRCVALGQVGLTAEDLARTIREDVDTLDEFERETGTTPTIYKLIPVGVARDFDGFNITEEV